VANWSGLIVGKACESGAGAFRRVEAAEGGAAPDNAWVSLLRAFPTVPCAGRD
jgi:hypothetical protein